MNQSHQRKYCDINNRQQLTPIREFLVLPMVVKVLRLKMMVNWAFSGSRVRGAKAGCWILGQRVPGFRGPNVSIKLLRPHAISPSTIL